MVVQYHEWIRTRTDPYGTFSPLPQMERALSADLERVSSSVSNEGMIISIQLLSNDSSLGDAYIRVPEGQIARDAIQAAYATLTADQMKRLVVCMGGDEIDMESSFEANGIEDGARLEVCVMLYPCLMALLLRLVCVDADLRRSLS